MVTVAGGIVLGVIALYLLGFCSMVGLLFVGKVIASLHDALETAFKWRDSKFYFHPKTNGTTPKYPGHPKPPSFSYYE